MILNPNNPFFVIHTEFSAKHAASFALCIQLGQNVDGVYTAVRVAQATGGLPSGDYFSLPPFSTYVTGGVLSEPGRLALVPLAAQYQSFVA